MPGVDADREHLKDRVASVVDELAADLIEVSHSIHDRPETNYEEAFAHELLASALERAGLAVTRGAYGVPTAFEARAGRGGTTVAVLCEYDALPGIGHACGHNVIAAAGLGAGLAAARLADQLGGRVVVLGTPAEEGGGGKVRLIEAGAFDGVDAALMVHPADHDLTRIDAIAVRQCRATYHGVPAHAAARPEEGRNALDAAILGYLNVAALRQHIAEPERIHGIITHGGDKANIVPERAVAEWMVRSPTLEGLAALEERFVTCLRAGAEAADCQLELEWIEPVYADLIENPALADAYRANAARLGRVVREPNAETRVVGSTDMGNVSQVVPAIHPMIKATPDGVKIHTPEFARYARGTEGDLAVVDGAKALAFTVVDLWLDAGLVEAVAAQHRARRRSGAIHEPSERPA